jgi:hypothetical protein
MIIRTYYNITEVALQGNLFFWFSEKWMFKLFFLK